MPKLWDATIEAHRTAVRDTILDTGWALAHEHGPLAVTMSQIAESAGIGRATLYKYFTDVQTILVAWHERHLAHVVEHLTALASDTADPNTRLKALFDAYAQHSRHRGQQDAELAALVHRGSQLAAAERQLHELFRDRLVASAEAGLVRTDVTPDELAVYCQSALDAARFLPSKAAVRRLVAITLDGLRHPD